MQHQLVEVYHKLLAAFGHQRWWPGETREEVIIGAILTQNVAWRNVETAIDNLRQHNLLTLKAINEADVSGIASLIRPTRFYNQKALKLKRLSDFLFDRYQGDLDAMFAEGVDRLRHELLNVGGLGEETVDSILLYAGNKAVFVVDAYTKRTFSRLGFTNEKWSYRAYQQFFMQHLDNEAELYNDYHAQIVRLGRAFCKKNVPECTPCPLSDLCLYCMSCLPQGCSG